MVGPAPDRDVDLAHVLGTLANPQRMRIVAALVRNNGRVGQLARALGISRVLVRMHLRRLEVAGLARATWELGADGETVYEVAPFVIHLTPQEIARRCAEANRVTNTVR